METSLIPLLAVLVVAFNVPRWAHDAPLRTCLVSAGFAYVLMRYLHWRLTQTVLPATGTLPEIGFVWIVFAGEIWLWYETLVLCAILLRRTDRSAEANAHEARLRAASEDALPVVDVFIATYNEPLDVLEKTIAGALSLDWPRHRLNIYVLDDGPRDWLAAYCDAVGVTHLTRSDNTHAKAGNINAAIPRTSAPFILVLDADFVPQRRMLMRSIGFFDDPRIGIVQMPHYFFNDTPLQTNMELRAALPDEQRFFFDVIQPGRDGWDCAFCCGSNGILRRSAVAEIGGSMPTASITEDMLLTLAMLRKGYITRYLGERLAVGLAPESIDAYFVQRERWARGAIQLFYTKLGPLGPGLRPMERLLFSPSHWLSQSLCQPLAMATPAIFLLTGCPPLVGANLTDITNYQIPAIVAVMAYLSFLAPRQFEPVASTVESVMQSFRLMPSVLWTLIKPHGHAFQVTPKGSSALLGKEDRFTIAVCILLIAATGFGIFLNSNLNTRIVDDIALLPIVAFWSVFNMAILLVVMTAVVPRPTPRSEERFPLERPCRFSNSKGEWTGESIDVSLSGARVQIHPSMALQPPAPDTWLRLDLAGIGPIAARVERLIETETGPQVGLHFHRPVGVVRQNLLRDLFASGLETGPPASRGFGLIPLLIARAFWAADHDQTSQSEVVAEPPSPPEWLVKDIAGSDVRNVQSSASRAVAL